MSRVSRAPTLMPTALARTRCDRRCVDFTAISAAIQPPSETPTTTVLVSSLIHKIQIKIREIIHMIEGMRLLGRAEARMRRRDHTRLLGQPIEYRSRPIETDSRMQKQQRLAAPALDHLHADAVDGDGGWRI